MEVNAQHCHRILETLNHPNICRLCETWTPWIGHSLAACTLALLRIDSVRRNPIVEIGRGPNNDVMLPGMRCETLSFPLIFCIFHFSFCMVTKHARARFGHVLCSNHFQIKWDGCEDSRSNVIVHDSSTNGTWVRAFCSRT